MAITSADPDNDPNTPKPALSFGNSFNVDSDADGNQSLRAEFPEDTGSSSLSEYYRGGGIVPSSTTTATEVSSSYGTNRLVETIFSLDGAGTGNFPGSGTADDIRDPVPEYLFFARKITAYGANLPIAIQEGWQVGDLLFAWQEESNGSFYSYTFKIPFGVIGKEYEHTDGFTYSTGPDASGVPFLIETVGEPNPFIQGQTPTFMFEIRDVSSFYNQMFERYYIRRRTTANAVNNQTVDVNVQVPSSGPISFSQLYGSKRFFQDSANIPGHVVSGSNNYIYNSPYPGNITTDGTDVRSGTLPNTLVYRDGPSVGDEYRVFDVPLGTFYVDPATYAGGVKFTLKPTDASSTDIQIRGGLDDDGGDAYVAVRNVGIRIRDVATLTSVFEYTGEVLFEETGQSTSGNGRSFNRYFNRFNVASERTEVSSATINSTGRFIVFMTFEYKQPASYTDPDFTLEIDSVKIEWETA